MSVLQQKQGISGVSVLLLLISTIFVAAVCTQQEAQTYLAEGTDFTFPEQQSTDFIIILDRSGSMRGEKIEQAKQAATTLVEQLGRGDQAAIIGFDSRSRVYSDLTENTTQLQQAIEEITVGDFTQYGQALTTGLDLLNGRPAVIIFMSDGKPDDMQDQITSSVDSVLERDVCIFTIAYGTSADDQAQQSLQSIAQESRDLTGCGDYFRAGESAFELRSAFDQIYQRVSGDEVITVEAEVEQQPGEVSIAVSAKSNLNDREIFSQACFEPSVRYVIARNKQIVVDEETTESVLTRPFPAGSYEYEITVTETCGGECLLSGRTTGTFDVGSEVAACTIPWHDLSVLLTSSEYVEVHITPSGFSPQTVGTEGVVTFVNTDTKPRRIQSTDGSFISPTLQPSERWTYIFSPGVYSYTDTDATIAGVIKNEDVFAHQGTDLILILDRSGSMAGSPLTNAKAAANNLISVLSPQDRASLIVFSDRAQLLQQLTSSQQFLRTALDSVRSEGSTFYVEALQLAGNQLQKSTTSRNQLVIFLSDGAPFDQGGKTEIIETIDDQLGESCLYAIGYGEQGVDAIDLLNSMASFIQEKNGCGQFYFSTTNKEELSRVFGEIYALTQDPGLSLVNITYDKRSSSSFEVSTLVRSRVNGLSIPSVSTAGCIPVAEVFLTIGETRYPLEFSDGRYRATIDLEPGAYSGLLTARLSGSDSPAHVAVGASRIDFTVTRMPRWIWYLLAGALVILAAYVFIRWLPHHNNGV